MRKDGLHDFAPLTTYTLYYEFGTSWNLMMAASLVVMLPIIIIFFLSQRAFIEGITLTGIKG